MKKLIITIILFSSLSIFAQKIDNKIEQYKQEIEVNENLGNFEIAFENADKLLKRTIKIYGEESQKTAEVYSRRGKLYQTIGDFSNAVISFQKSIRLCENLTGFNKDKIIIEYKKLLFAQELGKFEEEAEETYQKIFDFTTKEKQLNIKEQIEFNTEIASLFANKKMFEISDKYFLKSYKLLKTMADSKEFYSERQKLSELRECSQSYDFSDSFELRDKRFSEQVNLTFGISGERKTSSVIVNGKATYLHKPIYPKNISKIEKRVPVTVTIDEEGNVISANAFCGKGDLEKVSEDAARLSKFSPTLLRGQPVKVTGKIVFNFIRK